MPIIKSAKKRVKQTEKATIRNAKTKRTLREAVKAFHKALAEGNAEEVAKTHAAVNSAIDTAAKKNIIHKNKAARRKAAINNEARGVAAGDKAVKRAISQPAAGAVKKTGAKKAAAKKATVKKATAAKTGAKKPAAASATKAKAAPKKTATK